MQVHWQDKWLQFSYNNQLITLKGISPTATMGSPITNSQLAALVKEDSILYHVQVHMVQAQSKCATTLPAEI
jgi:hypothetical protein